MKQNSSRRDFLKVSMGVAYVAPLASLGPATTRLGAAGPAPTPAGGRIKKAVQFPMLPENLSYTDRFKLAGDVGFDGVEAMTVKDPKVAEAIKKASEDAKVPIHSVQNQGAWEHPLTSSDPAVVKQALDGMTTSLHNARLWGAETVLLVPGLVTPETRYQDAWTRSQKQIRTLIPLAKELKVVICVEEVWNKFLLSPLEMVRYVDEFESPWVRSYFDVGNVVIHGYPQDWIRTLGKRFLKVHLKDFKVLTKGFSPFQTEFVNLGDGDIDWAAVRQAFADVGYTGYATTELKGGDEAYLRDLAKRVDKLVLGL